MNNIFYSTILLFFGANLCGQNFLETNNPAPTPPKAKVRFTYKFALQMEDSSLLYKDFYDQNGNYLEELRYDEKEEIRFKYVFKYSVDSLERRSIGYDNNDSVSTILIMKYNNTGVVYDYKQINPKGELLNHQKSEFNAKGQLKRSYAYLNHPIVNKYFLSGKYFYKGSDRNYYKSKLYNERGQLKSIHRYEYDDKGQMVAKYLVSNNERFLVYSAKYNSENKVVEMTFISKNESFFNKERKLEFLYNDNGDLIEEKTYLNGELLEKKKYFYKKIDT